MNSILHKPILEAIAKVVKSGDVTLILPDGRRRSFGDATGPKIVLALKVPFSPARVLADPLLWFNESYMAGEIDLVDGSLMDLMRLGVEAGLDSKSAGLLAWLGAALREGVRHTSRPNSPDRARRNVSHHYDLSREFYELFLDADMQYSCAYFEQRGMPLEAAQLAKKRLIAAKLNLAPGQDVLDIGSGWGGLGLYLARHLDVRVSGITLSREQLAVSRERAAAAGLDGRVDFQMQDYRAIDRQFDRIVSVGMFEHVGLGNYRDYFGAAARLLKPGGTMLLHTIGRSDVPAPTDSFIAKHIFPGGYIPSMSDILGPIERSGLIVSDIEVLRLHYAETLREWRLRFRANRGKALAMYGEKFCRMWELYLTGSEAAFRWGGLVVFQIQLVNDKASLPLTRDYVMANIAKLRAMDSADARMQKAPLKRWGRAAIRKRNGAHRIGGLANHPGRTAQR